MPPIAKSKVPRGAAKVAQEIVVEPPAPKKVSQAKAKSAKVKAAEVEMTDDEVDAEIKAGKAWTLSLAAIGLIITGLILRDTFVVSAATATSASASACKDWRRRNWSSEKGR